MRSWITLLIIKIRNHGDTKRLIILTLWLALNCFISALSFTTWFTRTLVFSNDLIKQKEDSISELLRFLSNLAVSKLIFLLFLSISVLLKKNEVLSFLVKVFSFSTFNLIANCPRFLLESVTYIIFVNNQLYPSSISFSLLITSLPRMFPQSLVRSKNCS